MCVREKNRRLDLYVLIQQIMLHQMIGICTLHYKQSILIPSTLLLTLQLSMQAAYTRIESEIESRGNRVGFN